MLNLEVKCEAMAIGTQTQAGKCLRIRGYEWQWPSQPWMLVWTLVLFPSPPNLRLFQAIFSLVHYVMSTKRSQMDNNNRSHAEKHGQCCSITLGCHAAFQPGGPAKMELTGLLIPSQFIPLGKATSKN